MNDAMGPDTYDAAAEAKRKAVQDRLATLSGSASGPTLSAGPNGSNLNDPGLAQTSASINNPTSLTPTKTAASSTPSWQNNPAPSGFHWSNGVLVQDAAPSRPGGLGSVFTPNETAGGGFATGFGTGVGAQHFESLPDTSYKTASGGIVPSKGDAETAGNLMATLPLLPLDALNAARGVKALAGGGKDLLGSIFSRLGIGGDAAKNAAGWGARGAEDLTKTATELRSGVPDVSVSDLNARTATGATPDAPNFISEGAQGSRVPASTSLPDSARAVLKTGASTESDALRLAALGDNAAGAAEVAGAVNPFRARLATLAKPAGLVAAGAGAGLAAQTVGQIGAASTPDVANQQGTNGTSVTDQALVDQAKARGGTTVTPTPAGADTTTTTTGGGTGTGTGGYVPPKLVPQTPPVVPKDPQRVIWDPGAPAKVQGVTYDPTRTGTTGSGGGSTGAGGAGGNQLPGSGGAVSGDTSTTGLQGQISSDLNEITKIVNAGANAPDVQAIFATQGKTLLDMLDKQIADLQASGSQVDPATANTLQTLRDELDRNLKATREDMARRGILESGITIEAEQILRKGNMSDQARILTDRLSRIQQNIDAVRNQKISTASTFGLAGANAQTQADAAERARIDTLRGQVVSGKLGLLNNQTTIEQAQAGRDFTAEQNDLQRQFAYADRMASIAANAADNAAQRQWEAQKQNIDQQFQASIEAQAIAAGKYTNTPGQPAQPSGTTVDLATDNFIAQLEEMGSKDVAIAAYNAALSNGVFAQANANPLKILQALTAKNWAQ